MIGIAAHRNGLAVLDGREDQAGVRAIMRTRADDGSAGMESSARWCNQCPTLRRSDRPGFSNMRGSFPNLLSGSGRAPTALA